MARPRKYSDELRRRAVDEVLEPSTTSTPADGARSPRRVRQDPRVRHRVPDAHPGRTAWVHHVVAPNAGPVALLGRARLVVMCDRDGGAKGATVHANVVFRERRCNPS
jgi:hypothetical protein